MSVELYQPPPLPRPGSRKTRQVTDALAHLAYLRVVVAELEQRLADAAQECDRRRFNRWVEQARELEDEMTDYLEQSTSPLAEVIAHETIAAFYRAGPPRPTLGRQ